MTDELADLKKQLDIITLDYKNLRNEFFGLQKAFTETMDKLYMALDFNLHNMAKIFGLHEMQFDMKHDCEGCKGHGKFKTTIVGTNGATVTEASCAECLGKGFTWKEKEKENV